MIVVSDTSPLRALAHLGEVGLLNTLFRTVLVPPAVVAELEQPKSKLPPLSLAQYAFITVRSPSDRAATSRFRRELDAGESEAIALALEVGADFVLIDELDGRAVAMREGLATTGMLGVLLRAKRAGLVAAVRPLMDRLERETGFFVSQRLLDEALKAVGE